MNLKCPHCSAELEGDVNAGDIVECPSCGQSFEATPEMKPKLKMVATQSPLMDSRYSGIYKSRDERLFEGVCAGLAHKYGLSRAGLRFMFLLAFLFFFFVPSLVVYLGITLCCPSLPTKNIPRRDLG